MLMLRNLLIVWAGFLLVVYIVMLLDVLVHNRKVKLFWGKWFRVLTEDD